MKDSGKGATEKFWGPHKISTKRAVDGPAASELSPERVDLPAISETKKTIANPPKGDET